MGINGAKVTEETSEKQQERLVASQRTARQAWQRAWDLLEKHFAGFDYRLTQTGGQYDFSVAGRVLRS